MTRNLNFHRLETLRRHVRAYKADASVPNLIALLAAVRAAKSLAWSLIEQTVREEMSPAP